MNILRYNNGQMVEYARAGVAVESSFHWQSVHGQQLPFHRIVQWLPVMQCFGLLLPLFSESMGTVVSNGGAAVHPSK